MARRRRKKLGEILLEWGNVQNEQIEQALQIAERTGKRIGEALIEAGHCEEEEVAKALASQFDMEYLNLDRPESSGRVQMDLVPEEVVKKHLVLPIGKDGGRLKLLIHDPMDLELLDLLRFRLNTEIDTAIASKRQIKAFIDRGERVVGHVLR